jgi:putative ABC transport system substrate-binding protein
MRRRDFITVVGGVAATWPLAARAQQPDRLRRIGLATFLARESDAVAPFIDAFKQSLRDLGYVEGKNVIIEYRSANGQIDKLPEAVSEIVQLRVDVIVTGGQGIVAAKLATSTIPIVMVGGLDPIGMRFIASLPRPGGNITGTSYDADPAVHTKDIELLKQVAPGMSRVALLWNPDYPGILAPKSAIENAAHQLGLELQSAEVRALNDLNGAFTSILEHRVEAIMVFIDPITLIRRNQIADFAAKHGLLTAYPAREFVEAGGLISYGTSLREYWRRAAVYVDKILKGANPAELPVEQPTKFELVINLKTAKTLGVEIPPTLLARADEVIQ